MDLRMTQLNYLKERKRRVFGETKAHLSIFLLLAAMADWLTPRDIAVG